MNILEKIQTLPEGRKRVIFWSVVIVISLVLLTVYLKSVQRRLKSFETGKIEEELRLPPLEEELKGMPKIEMPEIEEALKEMEEIIKEETYE